MLSHSGELLTNAWLLSGTRAALSPVKASFCRQSAAFSFFNLRKRDRMPTLVNIRISSTSFVKVFTAYGSSFCFEGFCLPPVTPYMSCPKELTSRRTRWEYSVVISCFQLGEYKEKHLVLTGDWLHSYTVQMVLLAITFRYYLKELHHGCTGQFVVFPWP